MEKLVITGGAGFLGYHIANQLKDKFEKILIIDIDEFHPEEYPENVEYKKIDIRNKNKLEEAFQGYDKIVHAAAALPLWKPKDIYEVNIDGTKNVLEAARKNDVKRVVYVSSTAVYGVPEKHPIYENDPLIGVGPYGESKIKAEKICEEYRKKGLIIPIVRPKTFIGTGRLGVFQILFDWVESDKKIPVIGNGKNRYQLLEVEDLVDSIYLMLTLAEEKVNDTFNVGARNTKPVKEYLEEFFRRVGAKSRIFPTPAWLVIPLLEIFWFLRISPLYKWVYGTAHKDSFVSIEKAEKILGWKPKYTEADALVKSFNWYKEHKNETQGTAGVTHRVAWKQGVLALIKKFM